MTTETTICFWCGEDVPAGHDPNPCRVRVMAETTQETVLAEMKAAGWLRRGRASRQADRWRRARDRDKIACYQYAIRRGRKAPEPSCEDCGEVIRAHEERDTLDGLSWHPACYAADRTLA